MYFILNEFIHYFMNALYIINNYILTKTRLVFRTHSQLRILEWFFSTCHLLVLKSINPDDISPTFTRPPLNYPFRSPHRCYMNSLQTVHSFFNHKLIIKLNDDTLLWLCSVLKDLKWLITKQSLILRRPS